MTTPPRKRRVTERQLIVDDIFEDVTFVDEGPEDPEPPPDGSNRSPKEEDS